jgi:hypothetical protein
MGDFSISKSIRVPKVTTGNASMFQSTRTFNESAQVCPVRSNVSDYGVVGVARDSINTYTAGCYSPEDRMTVENLLRPRYSVYLNANAISDPGVGDNDIPEYDNSNQNKPYADTLLGYNYVRPVQPRELMRPEYALSQFSSASPQASNNPQFREANDVQCFMSRRFENRDCNANL